MRYRLLVVSAAWLAAGHALALCNDPQLRLVCAEYFASRVVTEATLVGMKTIRDKAYPEFDNGHYYDMRAERVLRGDIATSFRVYEENSSGRATFGWKAGRQYLLFLSYSAESKSWELDGCGNSGPLADAKKALAQIDGIQTNHDGDGVIHGVISGHEESGSVSRVHVEARGIKGRYATTTNAKGQFQIEVPAGRYTLRAKRDGLSFRAADLSYEDPDNLRIEAGGCVQVQLSDSELTTSRP
jgi:hypothetical protein